MNTTDKRQLTIDSYTKEATNINNFTYLDSTIITFDTNNYYYVLVLLEKKLSQQILFVQFPKILERSPLIVLKR